MKGIAFFALISLATAFPASMFENTDPEVFERAVQILKSRQNGADSATAAFEPVGSFNAQNQYVNVGKGSGHEYQAPSSGDLRGPCPGLNAFANHGFIPRNGYATISQFVQATENVVGMGADLAVFLAAYGAIIDGSGTAWSIGGTPPIGSAAGGNGISGSHNKYESDASPTRPDLYQAGNDYKTVASQFQQMLDASPGSITIDSLTSFRAQRFATQKSSNPYFFNGPFTGVLVQPAAYTFIFRFMANHSAEYPAGYLSYDVARTWFGIARDGSAKQGQEAIPSNWYKRNPAYPYTIPYFLADVSAAAALHPEFLSIGGNTGSANSFVGVDVANLTGGVYNSKTFAQNNNFACFAYQSAANLKPDVANLGSSITAATNVVSALGCPQLQKIDNSQLKQFPGYTRSPANN